ncbi:MAG: hypothetical protein QGH45_20295 [Myxococcota bacterium]|nr:hypothetical protein [Myxococcota bacterium]
MRLTAPWILLALAACALLGCPKKTVRTNAGPPPELEPAAPLPPSVFRSLGELGPGSFGHLAWGAEDIRTLPEAAELERYHVQEARWGLPGGEIRVLEVRSARLDSTTAFLFDSSDDDLRTVIVRDLPAPPPPQREIRGFLPFLAAFPGKLTVLSYPEEDGGHARPYRFVFVGGGGVKFGLTTEADGLWYLDHVEFFDPEWGIEELAAFKYGGELVELDTIGLVERKQAEAP